jgi:hypothetical protein
MTIDESRISTPPAPREDAGKQFLDRHIADRYNFTLEAILLLAKHPGIRFEKVRKGILDSNGEIAGLFGAQPGTFYLLRPDLHIAGRWKAIVPDEILRTAGICLGKQTP